MAPLQPSEQLLRHCHSKSSLLECEDRSSCKFAGDIHRRLEVKKENAVYCKCRGLKYPRLRQCHPREILAIFMMNK